MTPQNGLIKALRAFRLQPRLKDTILGLNQLYYDASDAFLADGGSRFGCPPLCAAQSGSNAVVCFVAPQASEAAVPGPLYAH